MNDGDLTFWVRRSYLDEGEGERPVKLSTCTRYLTPSGTIYFESPEGIWFGMTFDHLNFHMNDKTAFGRHHLSVSACDPIVLTHCFLVDGKHGDQLPGSLRKYEPIADGTRYEAYLRREFTLAQFEAEIEQQAANLSRLESAAEQVQQDFVHDPACNRLATPSNILDQLGIWKTITNFIMEKMSDPPNDDESDDVLMPPDDVALVVNEKRLSALEVFNMTSTLLSSVIKDRYEWFDASHMVRLQNLILLLPDLERDSRLLVDLSTALQLAMNEAARVESTAIKEIREGFGSVCPHLTRERLSTQNRGSRPPLLPRATSGVALVEVDRAPLVSESDHRTRRDDHGQALTRNEFNYLLAVSSLGAVDEHHAEKGRKIVVKARMGRNERSRGVVELRKGLVEKGLIETKSSVGTWLTAEGIRLLDDEWRRMATKGATK